MSLAACAERLRAGDPDRFLAAMAAPVGARAVLIPIYAFNVEVARAAWVSDEPMIARMRLQWWRDTLAEIAAGGAVRPHEVATPLAGVLGPDAALLLDGLVDARRLDTERAPFAEPAALVDYLEATGGRLMQAAGLALGAAGDGAVLGEIGFAGGLANWLLAVPELAARGRVPLPPGDTAALADAALGRLTRARRRGVGRAARPAALAAWRARRILSLARRAPGRVVAGQLSGSEFTRRGSLLLAALRGV